MGASKDSRTPTTESLHIRVDKDALRALHWWARYDNPGVALSTRVRQALETVGFLILAEYNVPDNSIGETVVTIEDLERAMTGALNYSMKETAG